MIVDVVPNHMAIPVPETLNRQLWSVLRDGPGSPRAHWFDVDWAAQGNRLLLPILSGPVQQCLRDLTVDQPSTAELPDDGPVLRYLDHLLPLRHGTAGLPLVDLLRAQHYRLADWRIASTELNWRRFFDISSLIAIRVEQEDVFAATHGLLLRLVAEGVISGLRVDHPDGLADPRGYLKRLADETGGGWVVAEKILTGTEVLPSDWPCAGTTGYDALGAVGGLFVDSSGREPLTDAYVRFTGILNGFAGVAQAAKRDAARHTFAAEVSRLARLIAQAGEPAVGELSMQDLHAILVEMLAAFPVYRAYVLPGEPPAEASVAFVAQAAATACRHLPARLHGALGAVRDLVLGAGTVREPVRPQDEVIVRFQQTCGPVLAKGVEDTAFYRWSRLIALNEVGGEPDRFGVSPQEFHAIAGRLARDWPATMTTLSTHDTKRQEDVRARLAALAESPQRWAREVARWSDLAVRRSGGRPPEPDTEYLMWQTLVGAWPIERDRLAGFLRKAIREAKTLTSWSDPDTGYESAVLGFAEAVLGDPELTAHIDGFVARIAPDARVNSLGAKLVQLTMPGVADVYQGCELTGFSLVDPDNRRPVDFALRRAMLAESAGDVLAVGLDAEKLLVTTAALRLRRDHPDIFAGSYTPLQAHGPASAHAVAFVRGGHAVTVATRLPAGLLRRGGWADTALTLSDGNWRDVLTGASHSGPRLLLSALTRRLPVALLVPERLVPERLVPEGTSAR